MKYLQVNIYQGALNVQISELIDTYLMQQNDENREKSFQNSCPYISRSQTNVKWSDEYLDERVGSILHHFLVVSHNTLCRQFRPVKIDERRATKSAKITILSAKHQDVPCRNGVLEHAVMVLIGFAVIFYYRKGSFANVRLFPYLFVKLIFKQCSNVSIQYFNFLASEHPIAVFQKRTLRRQLRFLLPQLY